MTAYILFIVGLIVARAAGEIAAGVDHAFQWNFGPKVRRQPVLSVQKLISRPYGAQFLEQEFDECQTVPIVVESLSTNDTTALGVPPYYLLAFEAGGVPTTTMVGSDPANLSWQAIHKRGMSQRLS